eukprot:TRINITY_DN823_c1_g4_i1.p1 TRINITY_DN823_c1_g4~~TRINITY_DN823_c1_g4_i1.p1  ORF type:complete len:255 (+),score=60.38 TRINITY_DN823_c1_g4_i1:51-815(+)
MMLATTCAMLALSTLPTLPTLPTTGSGGRPGPPNKGKVEWVTGGPSIDKKEVNQLTMVEDLTGQAKWVGIPEWLHWSTAHLVKFGVSEMKLKLSCPLDGGDNIPCTFYVVLYNCVHCKAASNLQSLNGGLPGTLLSSGFTAGSCGPRFVPGYIEKETRTFPTVTYKYEMRAGKDLEIPLTKNLFAAAIFELSINQQCSRHGSVGCQNDEKCVYDAPNESCIEKPMCPPRFHGPVQGTGQCFCLDIPMTGGGDSI